MHDRVMDMTRRLEVLSVERQGATFNSLVRTKIIQGLIDGILRNLIITIKSNR